MVLCENVRRAGNCYRERQEKMTKQTPEGRTSKEVNQALSLHGVTHWRNNTGLLYDRNNRPVAFGLCPGSSDRIGIRSVKITPDMVGQTIGQFVACEIKSETGKPSLLQRQFLKTVADAGGCAFVARCFEDVKEQMERKL